MCSDLTALIVKTAIAVYVSASMPYVAAGQWLGFAVVSESLGERPTRMAVVPLLRRNVRYASFTHDASINLTPFDHLFWSLEVQAIGTQAADFAGVLGFPKNV
jgi:hypothetical protein